MEQEMHDVWAKFDDYAEECYENLSGEIMDLSIWNMAFGAFLEAISSSRMFIPGSARELSQLDEDTDYMYDVQGWLHDYITILEQIELYDEVMAVCNLIIVMFEWKKESPTFFRFMVATILAAQDNTEKYNDFCEEWYQKEPDDAIAAGCLISAKVAVHDLDAALELVEKHYDDDMQCDMTNDTLFFAVELVYMLTDKQDEAEKVHAKLAMYSEMLGEEIDRIDKELEDYTFVDDEEEYPAEDEDLFVSLRETPEGNLLS